MLIVRAGTAHGTCAAPPSKSYTHRALTLALLTEETTVTEPLLSADPLSTLANVVAFGGEVSRDEDTVIVRGGRVRTPANVLDCGNSGTTLRLHTAVAALAPGFTVLTGDASLRSRPMKPLLDALHPLGAEAYSTQANGCAPLVVRGRMGGGETTIPGDVSSQYVSALLIAGTQAEAGLDLHLTSPLKSKPYVDITTDMLATFGADVHTHPGGYHIRHTGPLRGTTYRVPGDYSTAAFPLAAAAITGGTVTVTNLDPQNPQGDKAIIPCLREFGCEVTESGDSVTVKGPGPGGLRGITRDLSHTPDMFPILTAVAAYAKGDTVHPGAAPLRVKESDRIAAMVTELGKMGVRATEKPDGAVIHGGAPLTGARVHTYHDHRVLMALAVAGLGASGDTIIDEHDSYRVSYPRFVEDFTRLGGHAEVRA